MRARLIAAFLCACCGGAAGAAGAELQLWSVPLADPLRLSSLPLDPSEGSPPPPGAWALAVATGYFNLWSGSWHTATIHRELGLVGKPLTRQELRELERRHPGDAIYRLDVEGWASEVRLSRGFAGGLGVTVSLPLLEVGRPHWDAISQDVHRILGWGRGGRDVFAHGQTVVYVWSPRRRVALDRWDELNGSGVGDLRVAVAGPLGRWLGGEQRWVAVVKAPTGARDTLRGSGGWDSGVRVFAAWRRPRSQYRVALGYSRLDPGGSFLGIRRESTWHALAELHHRWGERGALLVSARWDTSPLAGFTLGEPGKPAFFFTLGARRELARSCWVAVALGENLIPGGVAPDFTLHVQAGARLGGSPEAAP